MSYSRLLVRFCEGRTDAPALSILGTEPFAVSWQSTPESVLESIRQKAARIRLGDRLHGRSLADMLVRDPAAYELQETEAIPQGTPQEFVLKDVISMAIGFAKHERNPPRDSLSWYIQCEQGALPVCVFAMLLVLDAGEELPEQRIHYQARDSALDMLARAAEASNAAPAGRGADRTRRRSGTAAAYDAGLSSPAGQPAAGTLGAVSARAGRARQRGLAGETPQAAGVQQVPTGSPWAAGAKPGDKIGARRGGTVPITADGGTPAGSTRGHRTLSLEQIKDSPGTATPAAQARRELRRQQSTTPARAGSVGIRVPVQQTTETRKCTVCEQDKPVSQFEGESKVSNQGFCSRCQHYTRQLSTADVRPLRITVDDVRRAYKDGTLDSHPVLVPYGQKRCAKCKAVFGVDQFPTVGPSSSPAKHRCPTCNGAVATTPAAKEPKSSPMQSTPEPQHMMTRRDHTGGGTAAPAVGSGAGALGSHSQQGMQTRGTRKRSRPSDALDGAAGPAPPAQRATDSGIEIMADTEQAAGAVAAAAKQRSVGSTPRTAAALCAAGVAGAGAVAGGSLRRMGAANTGTMRTPVRTGAETGAAKAASPNTAQAAINKGAKVPRVGAPAAALAAARAPAQRTAAASTSQVPPIPPHRSAVPSAAPAPAPGCGKTGRASRLRWLSEIASGGTMKKCSGCKDLLPTRKFKVGKESHLREQCSSCRAAGSSSKPKYAARAVPSGTKRCGICEEEKAVDDFKATSKPDRNYCSRCMHYVSQIRGGSRSTYTVDDIKQAHKDGSLDKLFVPLGQKRCSNCTAVLPIAHFSAVEEDGLTRYKIERLMKLCNDCREKDAKLHSVNSPRRPASHGPRSPRKGGSHRPRSRGPGSLGAMGDAGPNAFAPNAQETAQRDSAGQQQPPCAAPHVDGPANVAACAQDVGANSGGAEHAQTAQAAAMAPTQAALGGRVADAAPAAHQAAGTPTMHAGQAQSLTVSAVGTGGDSAVGAMFPDGLGDAADNATATAAAAAAAAAHGRQSGAASGPHGPPAATDDAPPGVPNDLKVASKELPRVLVPHAQSLTHDACVSFEHFDSATRHASVSATVRPQLQLAATATAQSPVRPAPARAANFAAAVAGPATGHTGAARTSTTAPATEHTGAALTTANTAITTGAGATAAAPATSQPAGKPKIEGPLAKKQKLLFPVGPSDVPVVPVVPEVFQNPQNPFMESPRPRALGDPTATLRGSWREDPSAEGGAAGASVLPCGPCGPASVPAANVKHGPHPTAVSTAPQTDSSIRVSQIFSGAPVDGGGGGTGAGVGRPPAQNGATK